MNARISTTELVDRCLEHGIADRSAAEHVLHATLAILGSRLTSDEAKALAGELPAELAQIVERAEYDSDFDAAELYFRVSQRTRASLGVAREQADVVLRAVGESIGEDVLRRLGRALPEPIANVLRGPDHHAPPPHPTRSHAPRMSTLAGGRPGSRHPLAEAQPSSGHEHSVARSDDPHGDTKLSGAHGLTQEQLHETLAEGRGPSPDRPVSEASDDGPGKPTSK